MSYALRGGPLFDVSEDSDYLHTLLNKAIDEYARLKSKAAESSDEGAKMDPRLEAMVEKMLDKSILDGRYQQAIGMVLRLLVKVYQKLPSPDYLSTCQCLLDELEISTIGPAQQGSAAPESGQDGNATASEDIQLTEGSQVFNQDVQEADPNEATYAERRSLGYYLQQKHLTPFCEFDNLLILKTIKQSVEKRKCLPQRNIDWLSRATNWAKFSATAGLGVIHRSHLQQGRSLMVPYLPQTGTGGGGSPYSEGGALYALGLIYANHGEGIKQFLHDSLHSTNVEVIQHGACLGLGLAVLGTADENIFDDIKTVLYSFKVFEAKEN
ncbi:26S proteasome regulatory complex, non-ATPase subcomplex, Rpn2/Psmd1 subunit [Actinidia rufa]|uniref:26S proteasome regulatory complex, non-ATPase subcomplex, Rpn2/Psmd1 subunit n=1 Tax=Actinidia rufa TaxID=165716 RepID=A0A7J0GK59_9ERIC|nr:26S proteasome regulatory complex, non-ATPase subcomplex, Rpn2/Psmd1 subunit [Actinidia rufa]